jgi:glycosyltransferase involved in cell wall biosynthesis
MARLYRANRAILARLRDARGVIALSSHMADEMARHGIAPERIHVVPPSIDRVDGSAPSPPVGGEPWRLLFVARLDALKGAAVLLDALPHAARALSRPLTLTVVGDGPDRELVEARAAELARGDADVRVEHVGWVADASALRAIFARHHLLVMPSLSPEPFGLVGLEAGAAGVPTVAFDSGGIPDWLTDGVGGVLVRERARSMRSLAAGIARALSDDTLWRRLGTGARAAAEAHSFARFADGMAAAVRRLAAKEHA